MFEPARKILRDCLGARIGEAQNGWLDDRLATLSVTPSDKSLDIAFAMVPRRLGKSGLEVDAEPLRRLAELAPGWSLEGWTVADAARVLLLAALPVEGFAARFRRLCQTADVGELVALYRGLPLYPDPERLEPQVGEGLRTNVRAVFEAVAHGNPYPQRYFDTHRWNHMVLKALFIGCRLAPIVGLDARANEELARILVDFARERRAAGRPVPWELWRCVGPFARGSVVDEVAPALDSPSRLERQAAALALAASPDPAAAGLLARAPHLRDAVVRGELSWAALDAQPA